MAYSTAPWYHQRFFDNNGRPLAGGTLSFLAAGSTAFKGIVSNLGGTPQANPLTLDSTGVPPQYYLQDGLYDIVISDVDGNLVDKLVNIEAGNGSGGAVDDHLVLTNSIDTVPNYLQSKMVNTFSILWTSIDTGVEQKLQASVNPEYASTLVDHLVISNQGDSNPGTLQQKITDIYNNVFNVNNGQLIIPLDQYLNKFNPGTQTVMGTVNFDILNSTVLNTGTANVSQNLYVVGTTNTGTINAYNATFNNTNTQYLKIGSTAGVSNPVLTVDVDGNVIAVDGLYKVKISETDTLGNFLKYKILPGTGIQFTTVTDESGEHIAISTQTPPRLDMYKVSNGYRSTATYNTTPKDFWTQVGIQTYGSLLIPGGTIKPGMRLRMVHKILNATAAFTMVISQTGTGTGSSMTIAVPAGTSHVEIDYQYNPTFGDVYQNRVSFYQIINTSNPCTGVVPSDGQGLDITANMAFAITCQTATGTTTVGLHDVTLWVIP